MFLTEIVSFLNVLIFTSFWYIKEMKYTALTTKIEAHGRLLDPPARSSAWRENPKDFPAYYDDMEMYCGGYGVQWNQNNGKCGICGENWFGVKRFEKGGSLYRGLSVRSYRQGQIIDVYVEITANHLGWFEFRVCNIDGLQTDATQECLDRNVLKNVDGISRIPIAMGLRDFRTKLVLPSGLACNNCVFQWKYITGNNWGNDPETGKPCMGCAITQEQFYGCSDITIIRSGAPIIDNEIVTPITTRKWSIFTKRPSNFHTTTQGIVSTTRSNNNNKSAKCPNGNGPFADISSGCKKYFVCVYAGTKNEQRHNFHCQAGTLFNDVSKICDYPAKVKC